MTERSQTLWKNMRKRVIERDNKECVVCGSKTKLAVHHITPINEGGNEFDENNCQTLCADCHKKKHSVSEKPLDNEEIKRTWLEEIKSMSASKKRETHTDMLIGINQIYQRWQVSGDIEATTFYLESPPFELRYFWLITGHKIPYMDFARQINESDKWLNEVLKEAV